jgi:hypothetical protein
VETATGERATSTAEEDAVGLSIVESTPAARRCPEVVL